MFLGSCGFTSFEFLLEFLGDAFGWNAELLGGDGFPDWFCVVGVESESNDGLPRRCDGSFVEEFVGFEERYEEFWRRRFVPKINSRSP